jgi:hypothetical protein
MKTMFAVLFGFLTVVTGWGQTYSIQKMGHVSTTYTRTYTRQQTSPEGAPKSTYGWVRYLENSDVVKTTYGKTTNTVAVLVGTNLITKRVISKTTNVMLVTTSFIEDNTGLFKEVTEFLYDSILPGYPQVFTSTKREVVNSELNGSGGYTLMTNNTSDVQQEIQYEIFFIGYVSEKDVLAKNEEENIGKTFVTESGSATLLLENSKPYNITYVFTASSLDGFRETLYRIKVGPYKIRSWKIPQKPQLVWFSGLE